uniref:Uncharacterized protein n=1 Tax=Meloidogyne enterolobii TaxID=390850 RepID=A0A6V7U337_MELEN|nr:unnamed protein product [Meloidogyne enterolobii]
MFETLFFKQITDLRLLLDSIRKFHNSEVENFSKKIEHLEKIAAKNKHPSSQINQDYDDSILDDDDDVVVLLNKKIFAVSWATRHLRI